MQNLTDWLLANYGQEQFNPGLDRMKSALKDLFPAFKNTKIIIIAGTNGKGETTLRLSEKLKNHSHFVWTSPHIERITERFRNENGEININELSTLIKQCHDEKQPLSFYEFLFFVFCTWAAKNPPEYLLLEVGLGGKLDAVNVFDADLVLLPSISRDHQEFLGRRYDQILYEKLGTLRQKSTLIHFLNNDYLIERTTRFAESIGANVKTLKTLSNLPAYEFSLRNEALASAAYTYLTGNSSSLVATSLEHRGEVLLRKNEFIFFGSHNVDGLRKLILFLKSGTYNFSRPPYDAVIVAFSRRNERDLTVMLKMLKKSGLGKVVVTSFNHPKAASADELEALSRAEGLEFAHDIESYVQGTNQGGRMLVTGSYYFLGHFKSLACCR